MMSGILISLVGAQDDGVQIPVNLQQDVLLIYGDGYDVTGKRCSFSFLPNFFPSTLSGITNASLR